MSIGSVYILGCGWLGLSLAETLASQGVDVKGSCTSNAKVQAIQQVGAKGYVIKLPLANLLADHADEQPQSEAFWTSDQLVIAVSPGSRRGDISHFPKHILSALLHYRRINPVGRVLFCSSTGVYGDAEGVVSENTDIKTPNARAAQLLLAEHQVLTQMAAPVKVFRLGGLYGGERHPGKHLAGRQNIPNGDAPVNLVHRNQVINTLIESLQHPFWTHKIKNVVEDNKQSRAEFYTAYAKENGLPLPSFLPGGEQLKKVVS